MDRGTFDPAFFDLLRKAEGDHFWFSVRRRWIYDKIARFLSPPADFLEVGCGTGNVSSFMGSRGYRVTGCEFYGEALQSAWPGFRKVQADALALPFQGESFDIVGLFDVIEHFQDDSAVLEEAARVLRRSGLIAITVPAREELWSSADEKSLHKRRYTKEGLQKVLDDLDLRILLSEYMFMGLYVPMKYSRAEGAEEKSDPFAISSAVNRMMKGYFDLERIISNVLPLPIGTSLVAVARRE